MAQLIAFFSRLGLSEWLSLISAVVAFVSFLLSRATVRRQNVMQFEALRSQYEGRLIDWANATIIAIADAQRLCRDFKNDLLTDEEGKVGVSELRTRMSALLDQGRLFFPNQPDSAAEDGRDPNEAAYSGQSQPAIDALYRAYRVISDLGRSSPPNYAEAVQAVVAQRRRFVSEVFCYVDPRRREATLAALDTGRTRAGGRS